MKTKLVFLLTAWVLFSLQITHAATKIDPIEKQLIKDVDIGLETWGMKFLEDTVNVNSGTMNRAGVIKVADMYEAKLKDLGFEIRRIDLAKINRAVHLFASHSGKKGSPRLLLIGHLDTVFEPSTNSQKFEKGEGSLIHGPGVSDMKGGNMVMLTALTALKKSGGLENMNITVALLGDEEQAGKDPDGSTTTSRGPLIEAAKNSDYALCFEPTNWQDDGIISTRRSSTSWRLVLKGKSGHSSLIFDKDMGDGTAYPIAKILGRFYDSLHKEKYLTFNVGNLSSAGSVVDNDSEGNETTVKGKRNIIPPLAQAAGDLRTISEEQLKSVRARMTKIVTQEIANFNKGKSREAWISGEITFKDGLPSMSPAKGNNELLKQLSQVSEDLGYGRLKAANPMKQGAADIAFAAPYVSGALDGLGPIGFDYHTVKEKTDSNSIAVASKRAAVLLHRLGRSSE